jgi:hypothetical protein
LVSFSSAKGTRRAAPSLSSSKSRGNNQLVFAIAGTPPLHKRKTNATLYYHVQQKNAELNIPSLADGLARANTIHRETAQPC